MSILGNRTRIFAGVVAAAWALGSPVPGVASPDAPDTPDAQVIRAPAPPAVIKTHWRGVRVPPGILAGVPTGASPGGARLHTVYPPYPVGFEADPYFTPPAAITVPPPIVFAPLPIAFAPPLVAPPPYLYDVAPVWPSFDGGCFVPSDFAGQHGYYGSCAESLYQQWMSRPY